MNEIEQIIYDVILPMRRESGQSIEDYCREAARCIAERLRTAEGGDWTMEDLRAADRLGKRYDWDAQERDAVLDLLTRVRAES